MNFNLTRKTIIVNGIAAVLLFAAGWFLHRPATVTVEHTVEGKTVEHVVNHETTIEGPVQIRTVTRTRTVPGPAVPGPVVETVVTRVEQRAPITIVKEGEKQIQVQTREVTITKPLPGWALGAGLQLLPDKRAEISLERRLIGPVWARAWVLQPLSIQVPAVGVGLRVEF